MDGADQKKKKPAVTNSRAQIRAPTVDQFFSNVRGVYGPKFVKRYKPLAVRNLASTYTCRRVLYPLLATEYKFRPYLLYNPGYVPVVYLSLHVYIHARVY